MTKKAQPAQMAGDYIDDMVDVLVASAITGIPCLAIGAPGWGKTTVQKSVARQIFGKMNVDWLFRQVHSTMPPASIEGATDVPALLDKSVWRLNREGTAFDPKMKLIMLDEIGRGEDYLFYLLMQVLKREDVATLDDQPVVWATANFMPTTVKTEAFRERIGFWKHLSVNGVSLKAVLDAQMNSLGAEPQINTPLPTWDEILDIRKTRYTEKSRQAVQNTLSNLVDKMQGGSDYEGKTFTFDWHPRYAFYWQLTLQRMTVFHTGVEDFDTVPTEALKYLSFARVLLTQDEAYAWEKVVKSIADPVALAIEVVMTEIYKNFQAIQGKVDNGTIQRNEIVGELGNPLQNALANLTALGDDDRVTKAEQELTWTYGEIVQGRNPFQSAPADNGEGNEDE